MVSYAVLQDLIDRYGAPELIALTDRAGTGSPDPTVTGTALDDATMTIDSFLAGRYLLPLQTVPPVVTLWCCNIARFLLWKDQPSDAVTTLYKAAISSLVLVQAGKMTLQANAVETPENGETIVVEGAPRQFDRHSLRGF